jgi:hypothetical protein
MIKHPRVFCVPKVPVETEVGKASFPVQAFTPVQAYGRLLSRQFCILNLPYVRALVCSSGKGGRVKFDRPASVFYMAFSWRSILQKVRGTGAIRV